MLASPQRRTIDSTFFGKGSSNQEAAEAISEAFGILLKIGRMDGLGVVGIKLGQVLAGAGAHEQARQVLGVAREAWVRLDNAMQLEQVDKLLAALPPKEDASSEEES